MVDRELSTFQQHEVMPIVSPEPVHDRLLHANTCFHVPHMHVTAPFFNWIIVNIVMVTFQHWHYTA